MVFSSRKLAKACEKGDEEEVRELLAKKPNLVHKVVKKEDTALIIACNYDHESIVKLLLASGAHPDISGKFGNTAIYNAADGNNLAMVKILLEAGADVQKKNKRGTSALTWAQNPQFLWNEEQGKEAASLILKYDDETRVDEVHTYIKDEYEYGKNIKLKKNITLEELSREVEKEFGEGWGITYEEMEGEWIKIRHQEEVDELREKAKKRKNSVKLRLVDEIGRKPKKQNPKRKTKSSAKRRQNLGYCDNDYDCDGGGYDGGGYDGGGYDGGGCDGGGGFDGGGFDCGGGF